MKQPEFGPVTTPVKRALIARSPVRGGGDSRCFSLRSLGTQASVAAEINAVSVDEREIAASLASLEQECW